MKPILNKEEIQKFIDEQLFLVKESSNENIDTRIEENVLSIGKLRLLKTLSNFIQDYQ